MVEIFEAVCSYIGHREPYNADIEVRLQETIDQLVVIMKQSSF